MGKRARARGKADRLRAPESEYRDAEGNVLVLRGSMSPLSRHRYKAVLHDQTKLTEDSWRALARSSPWRWRTLHFTRTDDDGRVEAWVRRPGQLLVRDEQGRTTYESGLPYSSSLLTRVVRKGAATIPEIVRDRLPHEVQPTLREDGLVAVRLGVQPAARGGPQPDPPADR